MRQSPTGVRAVILNMFASHRGARAFTQTPESLPIVLTSSLLEWLRELPTRRALHMLKQIAELLRKHGEGTWPGRLQDLSTELRLAHDSADPARLVAMMRQVLACFGGVASLGDVYLSPQHGHTIKPEQVDAVNARLGALRTQLYLSARQTIARIEWRRRKA